MGRGDRGGRGRSDQLATDRVLSASENPAYWFAALRWLQARVPEFRERTGIDIHADISERIDVVALLRDPRKIAAYSRLEAELQAASIEARPVLEVPLLPATEFDSVRAIASREGDDSSTA